MKKNHLFINLFLIAFLAFGSINIYAQGVTTAAINGFVSDSDGSSLPGANVIAVHEPSGTRYGASTRESGVFNLPNLKIGGPYTVTVSFIGYNTITESGIFLNIGQTLKFDLEMFANQLDGVRLIIQLKRIIS